MNEVVTHTPTTGVTRAARYTTQVVPAPPTPSFRSVLLLSHSIHFLQLVCVTALPGDFD